MLFVACRYSVRDTAADLTELVRCANDGDDFIRWVNLSDGFSVTLATDDQLSDAARFCTNHNDFSIMGVDCTFNIGNFYVTLVTYHHMLLEDFPVAIRPILIHKKRNQGSYQELFMGMKYCNEKTKRVLVVGHDDEVVLINAIKSEFPSAVSVNCDLHFKANIHHHMNEKLVPTEQRQLIMDNIHTLLKKPVDELEQAMTRITHGWERSEVPDSLITYFMNSTSYIL